MDPDNKKVCTRKVDVDRILQKHRNPRVGTYKLRFEKGVRSLLQQAADEFVTDLFARAASDGFTFDGKQTFPPEKKPEGWVYTYEE